MKKLINFAVKRPASIAILIIAVLVLGLFNLSKLGVDLLPDMDMPVVAVMTTYAGAGPQEVEEAVSEPLESALAGISNVEEIQSISSANSSTLIVNFDYGINMDNAVIDVRDSIGMAEMYLPDDAEKPVVMKFDPAMIPVIQLSVAAGENDSPAELQTLVEEEIEPRLSRISEIASVTITGGQEREIQVELDPLRVENYGLSISQVVQFMQAENFDMSTGSIEYGERDYLVRSMHELESLEDIGEIPLVSGNGSIIHLRDIAAINDAYKEIDQYTRINGETAIGISCQKESDANTVTACTEVKEEMEKIVAELDGKLNYQVVMDQSDFIQDSINSTAEMLIEGAILAALVILLFLRSGRSTLIVFTAIPLSIIATFIAMYFGGYTVNMLTMGGLALGVGRIVDDSIVVFENIYRHRSLGVSSKEAAMLGAKEVSGAVLAATLTLVAVFFPIMMVEGIAGVLFKPLAITICIAIVCSYCIAITVIPMMSSRLLSDKAMQPMETNKNFFTGVVARFGIWIDNLGEKYTVIIRWALANRKKVVGSVAFLMVLSLLAVPMVGAEFMPSTDSGQLSISIETDKGATLEDTGNIAAMVEEKLLSVPEVKEVFTSIGNTGNMAMSSSSNQASISVNLVPKDERKISADRSAADISALLQDISGAKIEVSVSDSMFGGMSGAAINIKVQGEDLKVLKDLSEDVSHIVKNVAGTRNVSNSLADGNPEVQVRIDEEKVASFGLTPIQVATEVKSAMDGVVATRYDVAGDEIDVRVMYGSDQTADLDYLQELSIATPRGGRVNLADLADFELGRGPVQIDRVDQVREAQVTADIYGRDLKGIMTDIQGEVENINLPPGYRIAYGGENEDMMESFSSLAVALLLAIMLVYVVLVVQYESFFDPFIIMFTIPTAVIGVIFSLVLTGRSLSVNVFIGLIMLVGIVVSNAIVLIDYLKQLRERGMDRNAAIIEAGRVRLRPILMTSFSTILAMLPLALGIAEGAEINAPLATVVIGGLLVSTLITLVFVPVVYSIFDDWRNRFRKPVLSEKAEQVS